MLKPQNQVDTFWLEFEEKTGEQVLARTFGKYINGWDDFDSKKWNELWGLIIRTTGGFHFHHFPKKSLIDTLFRFEDTQKEKIFFIPKEKIISYEIVDDRKWWKKIFMYSPPLLVIRYTEDGLPETGGNEKKLLFEADFISGDF